MAVTTWLPVALVALGGMALMVTGVVLKDGAAGLVGWRQYMGEIMADAGVALTTGAAVGVLLLLPANDLENLRDTREDEREQEREERSQREANLAADEAIRRDNIRFVRELASMPDHERGVFRGFDLIEAQLSGLVLDEAAFDEATLTGAYFELSNLTNARFVDANLMGSYLNGADLSSADLTGAVFEGSQMTLVRLTSANLTGASFKDALLSHSILRHVTTYVEGFGPEVPVADRPLVDFSGADLTSSDLRGADLRYAILEGTDLDQISCDSSTMWPETMQAPPTCSP